jgi:hypothetical protein
MDNIPDELVELVLHRATLNGRLSFVNFGLTDRRFMRILQHYAKHYKVDVVQLVTFFPLLKALPDTDAARTAVQRFFSLGRAPPWHVISSLPSAYGCVQLPYARVPGMSVWRRHATHLAGSLLLVVLPNPVQYGGRYLLENVCFTMALSHFLNSVFETITLGDMRLSVSRSVRDLKRWETVAGRLYHCYTSALLVSTFTGIVIDWSLASFNWPMAVGKLAQAASLVYLSCYAEHRSHLVLAFIMVHLVAYLVIVLLQ